MRGRVGNAPGRLSVPGPRCRIVRAGNAIWPGPDTKKPGTQANRAFEKVENIGVEPMTSCMPCKRSSQLS